MDGQPPPTRPVALGGLGMADKEDFGVHPGDFRIPDSFGVGDVAPDFHLAWRPGAIGWRLIWLEDFCV